LFVVLTQRNTDYCIEDNMLTLKDHIMGNAEFQYCRNNNLIYKTSTGLEFPIPVADTDGISLFRTEKGIALMKWIRKHLNSAALTQ
jgi:hypothetical protein